MTVTPKNANATAGTTKQFTATVEPAEAPQDVNWSTSDETVTISETGLATIPEDHVDATVKVFATADGTNVLGEATLTITAKPEA